MKLRALLGVALVGLIGLAGASPALADGPMTLAYPGVSEDGAGAGNRVNRHSEWFVKVAGSPVVLTVTEGLTDADYQGLWCSAGGFEGSAVYKAIGTYNLGSSFSGDCFIYSVKSPGNIYTSTTTGAGSVTWPGPEPTPTPTPAPTAEPSAPPSTAPTAAPTPAPTEDTRPVSLSAEDRERLDTLGGTLQLLGYVVVALLAGVFVTTGLRR